MEGRAAAVLERYRAATSELVDLDLDSWSDSEVFELWTELETVDRRRSVVDQDLIEQLETRSLPHSHGYSSTVAMAVALLRVSPGEAFARVKASRRFGPQRAITGEQVQRIYPTVTAAQVSGEISAAHAKVIADTIEHLPHEVAAVHDRAVEATLTENAKTLDPRSLGVVARRLAFLLDQDGQLKDHAKRDRTRGFDMTNRLDGSASFKGEATPELAEYLRVMLAAYGKPKPDTTNLDGTDTDTGTTERDLRTPSQRRHDALLAALKAAIRAGEAPQTAGITATLVLTMSDQAFTTGQGTATTGSGYIVPASAAKDWLGPEYRAIAVLMKTTKEITAYSHLHRIFTEQQRLAMWARDQDPLATCGGNAAGAGKNGVESIYHTEAHHVTDYALGGPTSVDNGALLLGWNHTNKLALGWRTIMINGVPFWILPPHKRE